MTNVWTTDRVLQHAVRHYQEGRPESAERTLRVALAHEPADTQGLRIRAAILQQAGRYEQALRSAWRAVVAAPGDDVARHALTAFQTESYNAAVAAYQAQDFTALLEIGRGFGSLDPELCHPTVAGSLPVMLNNAAQVLQGRGAWDLALGCAEAALRLAPGLRQAILQKAYLHLVRKDYRAAWDPAVWRQGFCTEPHIWDGHRRVGNLLIYNTNGFGDFIQFMRFLPEARTRVETLHVAAPRSMRMILKDSPALDGAHVVYGRPEFVWDAGCDIVALPFAMGLRPQDSCVPLPYLRPPPGPAAHWSRLLGEKNGLRVGLVWARSGTDRQSVGFRRLAPLFAVPGVRFFGLQNNEAKKELFDLDLPASFTDLGLFDWGHLAAVMANLDVVIAPDCGMLHLASALGVPAWAVLQRYSEWRWGWEGETSDWYPTVRIFRQDEEGDWSGAIAKVEAALRDLAAQRP